MNSVDLIVQECLDICAQHSSCEGIAEKISDDIKKYFGILENEKLSEVDYATAAGNNTLHGAIDYWQKKAFAAQAENLKLREAFSICNFDASVFEKEDRFKNQEIVVKARQALATPFDTAELEAYVESEIEKRMGEPKGYMWPEVESISLYKDEFFTIPLYAKKDEK